MSQSLNKVCLIGFVGRDPEARIVPSNSKEVVSFTLATSESWKDKTDGALKSKTEWHNIVVWNEHFLALTKRAVKKGMRLYVEGELVYKKSQDKVYAEITLQNYSGNIIILTPKTTDGNAEETLSEQSDNIPF